MSRQDFCKQCGESLPSSRWSYCSGECRSKYSQQQYRLTHPLMGKTSATTGTISELRAAANLLSKGYDVFRSLSPNCPCDLAILKDGKLLRIEVRTSYKSASGKLHRTISKRGDPNNIDHYAWVLSDEIIYEPALP